MNDTPSYRVADDRAASLDIRRLGADAEGHGNLAARRPWTSGWQVRQAPSPLSVTPRRRENGGRVVCRRRRFLGV